MKHQPDCKWERTTPVECVYRQTHNYCPHAEHTCTCTVEENPTASQDWAAERAAIRARVETALKYSVSAVDYSKVTDSLADIPRLLDRSEEDERALMNSEEQNQRIRERLGWSEGDLLSGNIKSYEQLSAELAASEQRIELLRTVDCVCGHHQHRSDESTGAGRECLDCPCTQFSNVHMALAAARQANEWQPMDSAPKDGTDVLLIWQPPLPEDEGPTVVLDSWYCRRHQHQSLYYDCPDTGTCDMGWGHYEGEMLGWRHVPAPPVPLQ